MDKLLGLLNEYEEVKYGRYGEYEFVFDGCIRSRKDAELLNETIISKKFGFIQRLVENDKINWRRCLDLWYEIAVIDGGWEDVDVMRTFDEYEQLLMYIAIQDNPIDFLISILK